MGTTPTNSNRKNTRAAAAEGDARRLPPPAFPQLLGDGERFVPPSGWVVPPHDELSEAERLFLRAWFGGSPPAGTTMPWDDRAAGKASGLGPVTTEAQQADGLAEMEADGMFEGRNLDEVTRRRIALGRYRAVALGRPWARVRQAVVTVRGPARRSHRARSPRRRSCRSARSPDGPEPPGDSEPPQHDVDAVRRLLGGGRS